MKTYYYITGNTYQHKEKLKSLGCKWDAIRKGWYADNEYLASQARIMCDPEKVARRNKLLRSVQKNRLKKLRLEEAKKEIAFQEVENLNENQRNHLREILNGH